MPVSAFRNYLALTAIDVMSGYILPVLNCWIHVVHEESSLSYTLTHNTPSIFYACWTRCWSPNGTNQFVRINKRNEREHSKPSSPNSFCGESRDSSGTLTIREDRHALPSLLSTPKNCILGHNCHQDSGGAAIHCIPRDYATPTVSQEFLIMSPRPHVVFISALHPVFI